MRGIFQRLVRGDVASQSRPELRYIVNPTRKSFDPRAVSIVPGTGCCDVAEGSKGMRNLMKLPPILPLKGCTSSSTCACRYQKHADRRQRTDRRRNPFGLMGSTDIDRRLPSDRRATES